MKDKLNYGQVALLGFGFFGVSLLWAVYNAFVPIFLQAGNPNLNIESATVVKGFGLSAAFTGFIMSLDNIAAVFIQPIIGVKSDNTRTRFGRRMPYIMVGAPLTVLGFMAIPFTVNLIPPELNGQFEQLTGPFLIFIICLGITLLAAAIYRTPAVALMPDIVPSPYRSQANGIINLMGGLGVVVGLLAGGALFKISATLPFVVGGILVLISAAIVISIIKEPRDYEQESVEKQPGLMEDLKEVWQDKDGSVLYLLLAIFAWFLAYNALETFFTSYATFNLGIAPGRAAQLFTIAGVTFIVCAIPAGYLAGKFGRKRTIIAGLIGFFLGIVIILVLGNETTVSIALGLVGASWALVNINSLPMVVDSVSQKKLGAYTGLYYFASMFAAIIGPVTIGLVVDSLGYQSLFLASATCLLIAAGLLSRVTKGEALTQSEDAPLDVTV